jgi:hypothetical protein
MEAPPTPSRRALVAAAALLVAAGFAAGWVAGRSGRGARPRKDGADYVQRREGPQRLVNPLLDCDLAADVLGNQELAPFRRQVVDLLEHRLDPRWASSVSVYFRELNDGLWFSVGETERFVPASLRKVPLMIALLREAEVTRGKPLLDREVPIDLARNYNLDQSFPPSQALDPGRAYPVRELIRRMIVYSDNNAFMVLSRVVDPGELERAYALLRMQDPGGARDDEYLSVETYASFFRILYNATYLSHEASEWALQLLAQSEFRAGLVAGVPPGVTVAHKFGEKANADGTRQLHDCGIVYYPNNPYILCVMSRGSSFEFLDDVIVAVSRLVWSEVSRQLGPARRPPAAPGR